MKSAKWSTLNTHLKTILKGWTGKSKAVKFQLCVDMLECFKVSTCNLEIKKFMCDPSKIYTANINWICVEVLRGFFPGKLVSL